MLENRKLDSRLPSRFSISVFSFHPLPRSLRMENTGMRSYF